MKDIAKDLQINENNEKVSGYHSKGNNSSVLREEDRYLLNPDTFFSNKLNSNSYPISDFKPGEKLNMRTINFENICLFSNHNTPPVPITINKIQINNN